MPEMHFFFFLFLTSKGRDGNFGSLHLYNCSRLLNNQSNMQIAHFSFWFFLCFACSHFPRVVLSATSRCHAQCVGQRDMEGGGWAPKRLRGDDIMDTRWARKHSWTNFGQNILSRRVLPPDRSWILGYLNTWIFQTIFGSFELHRQLGRVILSLIYPYKLLPADLYGFISLTYSMNTWVTCTEV